MYADDAEAARAFFRDVLEWPFVDAHGGWLIFKTGPSEMGVHPTSGAQEGRGDWSVPQHHEITLVCDDLDETISELSARGAEFNGDPPEQAFGRVAMLKVPGAEDIMIYQPSHPTAYDLDG